MERDASPWFAMSCHSVACCYAGLLIYQADKSAFLIPALCFVDSPCYECRLDVTRRTSGTRQLDVFGSDGEAH